jgi:UDPglucose 6-dehydrogenase
MKIAVLGLCHLGTVTAACAAAAGIMTLGIDDDADRVAGIARGEPPLFEPGLAELLRAGLEARMLSLSTRPMDVADVDIIWICYDTPVDEEDRADTSFVTRRVEGIFDYLKEDAVVVVSSQLPVGSIRKLESSYAAQSRGPKVTFACVPENLRLGQAIHAFQNPSRMVIGVRNERARSVLEPFLRRFCDNLIWTSVESAEMVKHAINAFLATSIAFTNEIATLSEQVGADAAEIEAGLRSDPRIGWHAYVKAGPSFAGGTLARDVKLLSGLARQHTTSIPVIDAILTSNRGHSQWAITQLRRLLAPLAGKTMTVLGLAYKPGTSSLRRSTAIELIATLLQEGAMVRAFDPQVKALPADLGGKVTLSDDAVSAAHAADALVLATEWPEFRELTGHNIARAMRGDIVLDAGRHLTANFAAGTRLRLYSVGRIA